MRITTCQILTVRKVVSKYGHLFTDQHVNMLDGTRLIALSEQGGRTYGTLPDGSGIRLAQNELLIVTYAGEVEL